MEGEIRRNVDEAFDDMSEESEKKKTFLHALSFLTCCGSSNSRHCWEGQTKWRIKTPARENKVTEDESKVAEDAPDKVHN